MEKVVTQDMMRLVSLTGKPKNKKVSLIKNHSILSKVNFQDHVGVFPPYFPEVGDVFLDD